MPFKINSATYKYSRKTADEKRKSGGSTGENILD